jgi:hypothetical protein
MPFDGPRPGGASPERLPAPRDRSQRSGVRSGVPMGGVEAHGGPGRRGQTVEESWDSLSLFLQNHMGRIGPDDTGGCPSPTQEFAPSADFLEQIYAAEPSPEPAAPDDWPDMGDSPGPVVATLPAGRQLVLNIFSTWGDVYYVGLTGIDIFDDSGRMVCLRKSHLSLV